MDNSTPVLLQGKPAHKARSAARRLERLGDHLAAKFIREHVLKSSPDEELDVFVAGDALRTFAHHLTENDWLRVSRLFWSLAYSAPTLYMLEASIAELKWHTTGTQRVFRSKYTGVLGLVKSTKLKRTPGGLYRLFWS